MLFSFFNRFLTKHTSSEKNTLPEPMYDEQIQSFNHIAKDENAFCFHNFDLFYRNEAITIDLLFFFPERGLCFAERLDWDFDTLENATIKRFNRSSKSPATTRLESTHAAIHQKLEEIHSFDTTACERFIWMPRLREDEFDRLDSSFHQLLSKDRVIFCDSTQESILAKFYCALPLCIEPYPILKIIGSLQSHTLILPSPENPYGQFLSDEQRALLDTEFSNTTTTLFGEHNSGKSALLIRKALLLLLKNPKQKILIVTPTLIAGEILRNELVSIAEYGALNIEYASLHFYAPDENGKLEESEVFQSASSVLCDDAYLLNQTIVDALIAHRGDRWLLLSMHNHYVPVSGSSFILHNHYQKNIPFKKISSGEKEAFMTLIMELRTLLQTATAETVMILFNDITLLKSYKEKIDEYFGFNSRVLTPSFSLQYQNLDTLLLATPDLTSGIHIPHVFLLTSDETDNYTYALSRASETATIISFSNPLEQDDPQSIHLTQES